MSEAEARALVDGFLDACKNIALPMPETVTLHEGLGPWDELEDALEVVRGPVPAW